MDVHAGNVPIVADKEGFSIREVGKAYGLSKGFLMLEIKRGRLGARRLGRRVIILKTDLVAYLEANKT